MSDSLLPPSASSAERSLEAATARVGAVPTPARDVWNPDTCPVSILPWLAWAFSLDEWNPAWTELQKRAAIKSAVAVQRKKGTIGAVRNALGAVGFNASVREWFGVTPNLDPYTFDLVLTVDQVGIPQDALGHVLDVLNGAKNLRSHLNDTVLTLQSTAATYHGGVALVGSEITIPYAGVAPPAPAPDDYVELREDGGFAKREDGGFAMREVYTPPPPPPPPPPGPLDAYAASIARAYGLRRLLGTDFPYLVQVRRSIDGAVQDIGFASDRLALNVAALLAFVLGGDGYVVKWYDQKGVSDATMSDASRQPKIVDAGNYLATVYFDGVDDTLALTAPQTQAMTVGGRWKLRTYDVINPGGGGIAASYFGSVGAIQPGSPCMGLMQYQANDNAVIMYQCSGTLYKSNRFNSPPPLTEAVYLANFDGSLNNAPSYSANGVGISRDVPHADPIADPYAEQTMYMASIGYVGIASQCAHLSMTNFVIWTADQHSNTDALNLIL